MKLKPIAYSILTLSIFGCSDADLKKQLFNLQTELEKIKIELENCSAELTEIKNTPENRFIRAKNLLSDNDLEGAKAEFQGIVENFKGTHDADIAGKEIAKIDKIIEQKRIE